MSSGSQKWIRSLRDNPAGKVVSSPNGSRWEWDQEQEDETARLLRKLQNDELAIERSGIVPTPGHAARGAIQRTAEPPRGRHQQFGKKPSKSRDAGGGFDPYDNPGKPNKR